MKSVGDARVASRKLLSGFTASIIFSITKGLSVNKKYSIRFWGLIKACTLPVSQHLVTAYIA
jgi:hypothetical protein